MSIKHSLIVTMTEEKRKELEQLISDLKVCSDANLPCRLCSLEKDGITCGDVLMRGAAKALESLLEGINHE